MAPLSLAQIEKIIIDTLSPLGVVRISLFGSFSRGETNPGDIDILVKLPDPKSRKAIGMRWFVLDQELSEKIGMSVDLVSEDSVSPVLRKVIDRDRRVIYEKTG